MAVKRVVVLVTSILLLGVLFGTVAAGAPAAQTDSTIVVDDGSDCTAPETETNISDAVANATDGDTIVVCPGTYNESVTVNKSLTIIANETNDDVVLDGGNRSDSAFVVTRNDTTIEGFQVRNYEQSGDGTAGITLTNVSDSTVANVTVVNAGGVAVVATASASVQNVSVTGSGVAETAAPALRLAANGTASMDNVTVEESRLEGNKRGLQVNLSESATATDLTVTRTVFANTTDTAVLVDEAGGSTLESLTVTRSLVTGNQSFADDAALRVSANTDPAGIDFRLNVIENTSVGVDNQNASAIVDARFNYWGVDSGPSSLDGTDLKDPASGEFADGGGAAVSGNATSGEANVRFDPWLGKTVCNEQNFVNVSSSLVNYPTIRGVSTDSVATICAWERAILPLRSDGDNAVTDIQLPSTFIETDDTGSVPINREEIAVYQRGRQVNVTFDQTTGANTTRFAYEDVEVLVVRANDASQLDNVTANGELNLSTYSATFSSNAVKLDLLQDGVLPRNGTLDDEGAMTIQYTPQEPKSYAFVLVRRDYGKGLNLTADGNLSVNGKVDILGVEQVRVQQANSTVTPRNDTVVRGDNVTVDVASNLSSGNTTQVVLLYNESRLADQSLTLAANLTTEDLLAGTFNSENLTVRTSIAGFNGIVRVEDSTTVFGRTLEAGTRSGDISTDSFVTTAFPNATTTIISPSARLDASTTVGVDRDPNSTLVIGTFDNFSTGTYEVVHIAQRGTVFSTDSTTVTIVAPEQPNEPPSADAGGPYTVGPDQNVTLDGTGSSDPDGTIASYQWTIKNDPTGEATLTNATSVTPTFRSPDIDRAQNVTVQVTVTDDDGATDSDTARVQVRPSAEEAPPTGGGGTGGGGGGGGGGPSAEFVVNATASDTEIDPGRTITIEYRVQNVGPISGFYEAELVIDGRRTGKTNTFNINSNGVVRSTFQTTLDEEAEYIIAITNTRVATVKVTGPYTTDIVSVRGTGRSFNFSRGPVTRLQLERLGSGKFTVATLNSVPPGLPAPPSQAVQAFNITVPASVSDSPATVTFAADRNQLDQLGIPPERVQLARYNEETGEWERLETTLIERTDGRIIYRAETPGFSTFAIVGQEATPTATPTATVTPTDTPADTATDTRTPTPGGPGGGIGTIGLGIVAVLLVVLLIIAVIVYLDAKGENPIGQLREAVLGEYGPVTSESPDYLGEIDDTEDEDGGGESDNADFGDGDDRL